MFNYFFSGFCPKYNTDKKQVEENYAKGYECLTFTNGEKCPLRYQSSDAYKCIYINQNNFFACLFRLSHMLILSIYHTKYLMLS